MFVHLDRNLLHAVHFRCKARKLTLPALLQLREWRVGVELLTAAVIMVGNGSDKLVKLLVYKLMEMAVAHDNH